MLLPYQQLTVIFSHHAKVNYHLSVILALPNLDPGMNFILSTSEYGQITLNDSMTIYTKIYLLENYWQDENSKQTKLDK